ncbi:MAG: hypothetical protein OIN84_01175, partial [Candidatus Methanoperedens sp.]|nr:hypothetical protein [Candidatus Methanoperedens sp.]
PYEDRVVPALIHDDCPMPCFMGIRPGITSIDAAVYRLTTHAWSSSSEADFPAQVRYAVMYNAVLPRTLMNWRWSEAPPDWIDRTELGGVLVEDRDVLNLTIRTNLSVGEFFLAFGAPDASSFLESYNHEYRYTAWYARLGLFISAQGPCPVWHSPHFPVHVSFPVETRRFFSEDSADRVC